MPKTIECADALDWLPDNRGKGAIVTSLPDAEETGQKIPEWQGWFQTAAVECIKAAADGAPIIFYQTDRKAGGELFSKAGIIYRASIEADAHVLWHKIALRRAVGAVDLHRPGYTHLICLSRTTGAKWQARKSPPKRAPYRRINTGGVI